MVMTAVQFSKVLAELSCVKKIHLAELRRQIESTETMYMLVMVSRKMRNEWGMAKRGEACVLGIRYLREGRGRRAWLYRVRGDREHLVWQKTNIA